MSTWSQLEQLLTCAICLDRFRNPKLLPCQHTFCGEPCMEGLVDYARRQIKCPECRAEHRIPYNGVQSFPNNVTLARFLDLHRGITGEEPEPLPSQMDRCGVCGEKSFCLRCAHCEKKVCEECRTAHLDILRREINRINTQVRRGLSKLTEQAEQTGKSSERLILISSQIRDEITESVRRLIKDLKDKETKLLSDLDEFTQSESKNSEKLNEDLETELVTITSNCELVEDHVTEQDEWTDAELMEYKDIFLKTLEFLRNLDPDTTDLSRKIKYVQKVDLDNLRRTAADFGEIKITAPASGLLTGGLLSPSDSSSNLAVPGSNLTRSQSDHRLAAQFANSGRTAKDALQRSYLDVSGGNRYGSDSERERASSPPGRRGERFGSVRSYGARGSDNSSNFSYTRGWERPGDSEYEPSNSSNFRSRFMRERIRERGGAAEDHSFEEHDSDVTSSHRVRFQEEASAQAHQKLFDTEEMVNLRAPLSGIIKLLDSPHVMERLHQNEVKAKQREVEAKENGSSNNPISTSTPTVPTSTPAPPRPSRQISEDEIEKQKKQNKAAEAAQQSSQSTNNSSAASPPAAPNPPPTPKSSSNSRSGSLAVESSATSARNPTSPTASVTNRRVQALQKEDTRSIRSTSSDDGATSGPESGDVTCDDEMPSATSAAASAALNSASRRRIYASTHSSSGGGTGTGMSASVDFAGDPSATGRSKPSSAQAPATNRLLLASLGPDISITSADDQRYLPSGATQEEIANEITDAPRPISPLPSPSPTPSQSSELGDNEETSEGSEADTENETETESETATKGAPSPYCSPLSPESLSFPVPFPTLGGSNKSTLSVATSHAPAGGTLSNDEETTEATESTDSSSNSVNSSASSSPVPPLSPLPTTSTATLTLPKITVKSTGEVDDVEIIQQSGNITIMRRAISRDSNSDTSDSEEDSSSGEDKSEDNEPIQQASSSMQSNNYGQHQREPAQETETLNELKSKQMNECLKNANEEEDDGGEEIGDETEGENEDHDRLDPVENVDLLQWQTNELNAGLPPLDFNNNRGRDQEKGSNEEETSRDSDEETEEEEGEEEEEEEEEEEKEEKHGDATNETERQEPVNRLIVSNSKESERGNLDGVDGEKSENSEEVEEDEDEDEEEMMDAEDGQESEERSDSPVRANGHCSDDSNYYQSSYYGSNSPSARASLSRYGTEEPSTTTGSSSYYSKQQNRKYSRDEDSSYGDTSAMVTSSPSYYSSYVGASRRPSLSRTSTLDDDVTGNEAPSSGVRSYYNSTKKQLPSQVATPVPSSDAGRYGSSSSAAGSSYLRNRLAKSRSSHAIAFDDSDDDSASIANNSTSNPLSPGSSSYRSRFRFGSSSTAASTAPVEPTDRFGVSSSSARRISRSGYTYRTRVSSREPSPEEEAAGSVTQYLINKYGTRSNLGRPSMLSKSKSSHAIYGRSLSSSDEEIASTAIVPTSPYRRASRDSESFSYKSTTGSYGLPFPRYQQKGRMIMKIGSRGTNPGCFTWPRGVAVGPDNSIVVADSSNHRIQIFETDGSFRAQFGQYGSGQGEMDCPAAITVNRLGHYIISDRYNHRIQILDSTGRFLRSFGSEGRSDSKFSYPWGVATDALNFVYLVDKENHRVQIFQSDGTFVGKFGSIGTGISNFEHPHYLAVSNTNRVIVSDANNHRISIFDINGRPMLTFGSEGTAEGQFKFPKGVAVDNDSGGYIIVGDSGNNRIQIFSPEGIFIKAFGVWGACDGEFKGLEGVAVTQDSRVVVCDRENHRIQFF